MRTHSPRLICTNPTLIGLDKRHALVCFADIEEISCVVGSIETLNSIAADCFTQVWSQVPKGIGKLREDFGWIVLILRVSWTVPARSLLVAESARRISKTLPMLSDVVTPSGHNLSMIVRPISTGTVCMNLSRGLAYAVWIEFSRSLSDGET